MMSIVRTAGKLIVGAAVGAAVVTGVTVGFVAVTALNPKVRRSVEKQGLRVFEGALRRLGMAIEAGRYAAQKKEQELERLLEIEPPGIAKAAGPDYIV